MLRNFWYALEFTSAINTKPKRLTALGQDFVLYRQPSTGQVVALDNWCVHRGAPSSDGWLDGDCIRCPYHAWKYRADGVCDEIPANGPGTAIPNKARVRVYPVQEKYGWVWLFFGELPEPARPPLPALSDFNDPSLRHVTGSFHWQAHYTRVVENGIDIAHVPFVHRKSIGSHNPPEVEPYEVEHETWGARTSINRAAPTGKRWLWKGLGRAMRPGVKVGISFGFYMPHVTRLEVRLPFARFLLYAAHVPIDDTTTVTKWIAMRDFLTGAWGDGGTRRRTLKIYEQDRPIVEAQQPAVLPYDLNVELHVKSDAVELAYRRLRKNCLDTDWGITPRVGNPFAVLTAPIVQNRLQRNHRCDDLLAQTVLME